MKKQVKKVKKISKSVKKVQKKAAPVTKPTRKLAVISTSSNGNSKIMPLGDRVLVKPFTGNEQAAEANSFGLIIPETVSKERPEQGRVVARGEGRTENGKFVPMSVSVGDTVVFSKYGFDEIKMDGEEFYIIKEENILAIIRGK